MTKGVVVGSAAPADVAMEVFVASDGSMSQPFAAAPVGRWNPGDV
jgi:hypothetical protein